MYTKHRKQLNKFNIEIIIFLKEGECTPQSFVSMLLYGYYA
jgi:hypothetical protein